MALDRETVVSTALRLIDEGGLESLTLRKLASELGVQAPALYWHVRNKRELLDLVSERLHDERSDQGLAPAPGQGWEAWLEERLLESRRQLLAHRDSALIAAGNRPTENSLPSAEATLASLVEIGLPPMEALLFLLSTGYYVIGGVLERQQSEARENPGSQAEVAEQMTSGEKYPVMAAAMAGFLQHADIDSETDPTDPAGRAAILDFDDLVYRYGASLLIDGLRYRLEHRPPPPA